MIPKRIKIVNSIGILDGIGKREVEIDFTKFRRGIVGIFGHTGSGKSTIMENLTPFRRLISRPGSLHDQFIEEGVREFEFDMEENTYLSRILIDSVKKRQVAQLYQNGQLLNDKLEEYDSYVNELMGDYNLFINSVFAPQTDAHIITMKDTPMKNLFMMLFNLEKYSNQYLPLLKLESNKVDGRIQGARSIFEVLEKDINDAGNIRNETAELIDSIPTIKNRVEEAEKGFNEHQNEIVKSKEDLVKSNAKMDQVKDKQKQVDDLQEEISSMVKSVATEATNVEIMIKSNDDDRRLAEGDFESYEKEIGRAQKVMNNRSLILDKVEELERLQKELISLSSSKKEMEVKHDMLKGLNEQIRRIKTDIKVLDEVPCKETDYYHECKLLKNAFFHKNRLVDVKKDAGKTEKEIKKLEDDESRTKVITDDISSLEEKNWVSVKNELETAEKNISKLKLKYKQSLDRISKCKNIDIELNKKLDSIEEDINIKVSEKKVKKKKIEDEIEKFEHDLGIDDIKVNIERLEYLSHKKENELIDARNALAVAEERIKSNKKLIEVLDMKEKSVSSKEKEIADLIADREEYLVLEKFLKEAPIYELESATQVTTNFANELISLYNDSFSMKVITVLPKSKGGFKEVFKIMVFNNGKEVLAHNLSGGQKEIFDAVLRMSIVLTLDSIQSKQFKTSFWDESDKSIDTKSAIDYFEMHERALQLSNKHFTFLISHREKIQEMTDQKIFVEDL
ncbi:MAG: hypothetical protein ACW96U_00945 [Candidatus Heimdallarchaeaceae archaeon]